MHILVAGGAGFIGSHLCEALLGEGHTVVCLDNLLSGSKDNFAHLLKDPHFTFVNHDVCLPYAASAKLDAIFHLASLASPNPKSPISYMHYPVETLLANTVGTKNLLDLGKSHNCQIILASTAEIYGNPEVHPQKETYVGHVSSIGVRSSYDEGKRALEAFAFAYYRRYQVATKVVRIFNTYGPRMRRDDGRVVPNLIDDYLTGRPFPFFGNEQTTRSFGYVKDIVTGLVKILDCPALVGDVVNLGNPQEFTLKELVATFSRVTGRPMPTVVEPAPPDDPIRRCPDISKAKALLHWEPTIDLATGLKLTLESYQ